MSHFKGTRNEYCQYFVVLVTVIIIKVIYLPVYCLKFIEVKTIDAASFPQRLNHLFNIHEMLLPQTSSRLCIYIYFILFFL